MFETPEIKGSSSKEGHKLNFAVLAVSYPLMLNTDRSLFELKYYSEVILHSVI
jgi:hypothetical protein